MTANQFNKALDRLGYSQSSLARQIGKSDRMVRNWAAGKWPVPTEIALLLNLMLDTKSSIDQLRS
jgi:DNA-binding transcriptional regulator YiaG